MRLGAYAIERDYSHYVAYSAKTIFAVVGTATKGPVGEAVVCTSAQDLVNKFGPVSPGHYALYAGQYFLSQSSVLYFVRAAGDRAAAATVTIAGKGSEGADIPEAIKVECLEVGTYYNNYKLSVSKVEDAVATYTFKIKSPNGSVLETIENIDLAEISTETSLKSTYVNINAINGNAVSLVEADYTFTGGNDGSGEDIDDADYINAANVLSSETIDMNLFAVPGVSSYAVITNMIALAEARGDCLYLVDPPRGLTRDGVISWHNGELDSNRGTKINSSYGALYYDWVNIYDSVNKLQVEVPPSVVVAASYAYSDRTSELWYAPAGLQRGLISGALNASTRLSKADIEYLYGGNNAVNPIYEDPQVGLVLWGQKTLLREDSAMNRVNVRRLMNYLKRVITNACNYLTFEPNDRITWNSFEMKVMPTLEEIKNKRGIYEYTVVKGDTIVTDEDIDNYRMPCMIAIRPTKAAEEIPIYFVITSTGADFNEVLSANGVIPE